MVGDTSLSVTSTRLHHELCDPGTITASADSILARLLRTHALNVSSRSDWHASYCDCHRLELERNHTAHRPSQHDEAWVCVCVWILLCSAVSARRWKGGGDLVRRIARICCLQQGTKGRARGSQSAGSSEGKGRSGAEERSGGVAENRGWQRGRATRFCMKCHRGHVRGIAARSDLHSKRIPALLKWKGFGRSATSRTRGSASPGTMHASGKRTGSKRHSNAQVQSAAPTHAPGRARKV